MKILFLSTWFPPPLEGGSVVYVYELARNLPRGSVRVVTNRCAGQAPFDRRQSFPIWRCWLSWGAPGKARQVAIFLLWVAGLLPNLVRRRPDIVLAGDIHLAGPVAWCLKALFGLPYVVFVYAEELTCQIQRSTGSMARLRGRILGTVLRSADGIVGISDYTLSLLPALGVRPADTIKIVPMVEEAPSVDPRSLVAARKLWGLGVEDRVILTAGRQIKRKGHDQVLRAMVEVLREVPEAKLVIVGRGPEHEALKALAFTLGVMDRVVFAGFVPEDQMPALYDLCEFFVMPNRRLEDGDTEGFGIVFIEANAHGKPAIGGCEGGVKDAIFDGVTGLIVDGEDAQAVASAILRLLKEPLEAKRMGENGRRRVREELSPARGAARLNEYCGTVLRGEKASKRRGGDWWLRLH